MRETNKMADIDQKQPAPAAVKAPPAPSPFGPMPLSKPTPTDRQQPVKPKPAINVMPQTPKGKPPGGTKRSDVRNPLAPGGSPHQLPMHVSRHADRKED